MGRKSCWNWQELNSPQLDCKSLQKLQNLTFLTIYFSLNSSKYSMICKSLKTELRCATNSEISKTSWNSTKFPGSKHLWRNGKKIESSPKWLQCCPQNYRKLPLKLSVKISIFLKVLVVTASRKVDEFSKFFVVWSLFSKLAWIILFDWENIWFCWNFKSFHIFIKICWFVNFFVKFEFSWIFWIILKWLKTFCNFLQLDIVTFCHFCGVFCFGKRILAV